MIPTKLTERPIWTTTITITVTEMDRFLHLLDDWYQGRIDTMIEDFRVYAAAESHHWPFPGLDPQDA